MAKTGELKINQFDVFKDKDTTVYFKMSKKDANTFLEYENQIRDLIKKKQPIPETLFNNFVNLLSSVEDEVHKTFNTEFISKISQLRERFLGKKKYEFYFIHPKTKQEYCLSQMLDLCLLNALNHHYTEQPDKKEFCLKISYNVMQDYISKFPPQYRNLDWHYKLTVISAFVTMLLGHEISKRITETIHNGELPTNKELQHAVVGYTDKYQIKKHK